MIAHLTRIIHEYFCCNRPASMRLADAIIPLQRSRIPIQRTEATTSLISRSALLDGHLRCYVMFYLLPRGGPVRSTCPGFP